MAFHPKKLGDRSRTLVGSAAVFYCFAVTSLGLGWGALTLEAAEPSKMPPQPVGAAAPAGQTAPGQPITSAGVGRSPASASAAPQETLNGTAAAGGKRGEAEIDAALRRQLRLEEKGSELTAQTNEVFEAEVRRKTEQSASSADGEHRFMLGVLALVICATGAAMWMALREHRGQLVVPPEPPKRRSPFPRKRN